MNWTPTDVEFMDRALCLAENGLYSCHPNPRVGCVFVSDNVVIGEGWHARTGENHAEINAISSATGSLAGSTCYVTLEPCCHTGKTPPCTNALLEAGVSRVVVATTDPNPRVAGAGIKQLQEAGVQVDSGLRETQSRELNRGFVSRMERKRPFVFCKIAASLDGKVALASGESKWITGEAARHDVQKLRAASSAVMTGINTVIADDPRLNVRDVETDGRQPLRVVLDRKLRCPPTAKILAQPGEVLVIGQHDNRERRNALEAAGAGVEIISDDTHFIHGVMTLLAAKYQVNELMVEAGPTLSGSLLTDGLLDELVIYQSACVLGQDARDMLNIGPLHEMSERIELELVAEKTVGIDRCMIFKKTALTELK